MLGALCVMLVCVGTFRVQMKPVISGTESCLLAFLMVNISKLRPTMYFCRGHNFRYAWGYMFVVPALERLRQEDHEFGVNLGPIGRPC